MEANKDIGNEKENIKEETELTVEDLNEIISKKEEEFEELSSKLLRLQADFINYRKRTEKEKEGLINYGIETIACGLLSILDNFERALDSEVDKEDGFYKGVEMIQNQLIELLKDNGIEEIDALNTPFDPNFHHAVLMEKSEDAEEGTIIGVLQKGYTLKGKVIRPSMVRVAQ
ncbi:MAG: nucleotide exchange factor GrpE [Tissierellaceae bacterium]